MSGGAEVAAESWPEDREAGRELSCPVTPEEYADALTEIWTGVADASAKLAANITDIWWNALPVARPEGLNMAGIAGVLAARLAKLGPEGDPLESVMLGMIAYAQGAHGQAMSEVEQIEELRRELGNRIDENDS